MIGVGDLVVCVDASAPMKLDGGTLSPARKIIGLGFLNEGQIYCVVGINFWENGFALDGQPLPGEYYAATRFRKFEQSKQDAELIERIKSCKPVRLPMVEADKGWAMRVPRRSGLLRPEPPCGVSALREPAAIARGGAL